MKHFVHACNIFHGFTTFTTYAMVQYLIEKCLCHYWRQLMISEHGVGSQCLILSINWSFSKILVSFHMPIYRQCHQRQCNKHCNTGLWAQTSRKFSQARKCCDKFSIANFNKWFQQRWKYIPGGSTAHVMIGSSLLGWKCWLMATAVAELHLLPHSSW